MKKKKGSKAAGKAAKARSAMDRIAAEDVKAVLSDAKPAKRKSGRPRKSEKPSALTVSELLDAGALKAVLGDLRQFAAQGANSDLTHKERVKLTENDIHRPVSRTQERTRRNETGRRKQGDF